MLLLRGQDGPYVPPQAASAGFSAVSYKADFSKIDLANAQAPGSSLYVYQWFGGPATDVSNINVSNGVLTLGGGNGWAALESAISKNGSYVGQVFGGGGYFEAEISTNAADSVNAASDFPAFWLESIQHIMGQDQWPGQKSGYSHFGEIDIMELYHDPNQSWVGSPRYLTTVHDWSGIWKSGSGFPYNIANNSTHWFTPSAQPIDWSAFNKYGVLWVPQVGLTPGYLQFYFNNAPGPIVYWKGPPVKPLSGQSSGNWNPTTPSQAAGTYSVFDQQQFALAISTDPNWPMKVKSITVWQR